MLHEIRSSRPKISVLVLSIHPESRLAVGVFKLGAAAYMTKESAPEELVAAVKKVLAGGRYINALLAEKLAGYLPPRALLSNREFQVFRLIASGQVVSKIAAELALSVKTISIYRTRILRKMALRNNAELMHYAMRHHLVDGGKTPR